MTYVLNLEPDVARRVEERAAQNGTNPEKVAEEILVSVFAENRAERLNRLTDELFEERASAYGTLAEGSANRYPTDEEFEAAKNRVFDRYAKTFEILAEGAK